MDKPWHGTQYPVNRTVDLSNRFGAECLYAFTWPNGGGDAFEAVNGILLPKGGAAAATVDTAPLGYGVNCSNPSDDTRDHGYPIPASIAYTTGATENFVVSLYGSALDGSFVNFIGDESQTNNAMRFRNNGDDFFLMRLDGGNQTTIATTAGLTGAGAGVHLFTIVVDHDANLCLLYADGVLEGSVTIADEAFVFADLLMGFNATGFGWSGYMQEMQVFLTPTPWGAADVAAHADNFLQIYESDIIIPYLVSVSAAEVIVTITGQEIALEQGVATPSFPIIESIVGQEITVEQGVVTAVGDVSITLTGQEITVEQGVITVIGAATESITGQEIAVEQGIVTPSFPTIESIAGQEIAVEQGVVNVDIGIIVSLSGQEITTEQGVITTVFPITESIAGQEIAVEQGTVVATGEAAVTIAGQEITIEQGVITVTTGGTTVTLSGQELSAEQGVVIAVGKVNIVLTGQELNAQQGVIVVNIATDATPSVSFTAIKPQRSYTAVKPQRDYNAAKAVNIL